MKHHHPPQSPQFFLTAPSPCPYIEGEFERKVFTHLVGDRAPELNDLLTQGGFRRSQNIAYRPACESCRACVSVRIVVGEFEPSRSMRRVVARNDDLVGAIHDAEPSAEQYSLFRTYLDARHRHGGMSDMTVLDYAMMVEDSHVDTRIIEYRRRGPDSFITGKGEGELIAVALTDSSSSQFPFRILEGWRMEEVAAIIDTNPYFGFSGADFLQVVRAGAQVDPTFAAFVGLPVGASLEGYLFPNTYQLPAQITPVMLRDTLLQEFLDNIGTDIPSSASAQGLTIHQIVTLASIIQREAVHADEHPMIASVYRNRMAIGMKLDADPTGQYAIGFKDGSWWPPITQADYSGVISPYNTYLGAGLPPGPAW